jgi:hypothetical protein
MFANRVVRGVKVPCVVLYLVCVLAIVAYGYALRRAEGRDPLARRLYHHPICQDIDGWSVCHLLFFLVGAGWEVVETALGQNRLELSGRRLQLVGDQDAEGRVTGDDAAFWYGKESDIVVDALGYALGSALASRFWPNGA